MSYYIIIRGPLGCGKSTVSEALAKNLGAKHFAVDRVLDEHKLTEDKEEGYISQKSFFKANEIIAKEAKEGLDSGTPIIFDGNFYWESAVEDLVSKLGYKHYIFTLKAPVETCIKRDSERSKTHGEMAAIVVHKKSTSFTKGIEIDTENKTVQETLKEILKHLNARA